jgi:hypothetical protein
MRIRLVGEIQIELLKKKQSDLKKILVALAQPIFLEKKQLKLCKKKLITSVPVVGFKTHFATHTTHTHRRTRN